MPLILIVINDVAQLYHYCTVASCTVIYRLHTSNLISLVIRYSCLTNCHRRLRDVAKYIELTNMSEAVADKVIDCHLNRKRRRITSEQRSHVLQAFNHSQQPLYLKLVLDEVSCKIMRYFYLTVIAQ